ncbi:unnamed protein product [Cylicocyclus nassatus]|uniref:Apple domain-containing protein n=1 Tax=Cylicocyclus nassatus TaxID=53992 RepID=A0AA36DPT5_CYLNA|nr:unnamed protein product [Cylicocyclus nassatus]
MIAVSKIVFVVAQVILTHSFVFRSIMEASGNPLYFFYAANQKMCLKGCYEESNCTYVAYEHFFDGHHNNRCELYSEGNKQINSTQVYQLTRQKTDATCQTLDVARTITFQNIPTPNTTSKPLPCSTMSIDASTLTTFKASYYNKFRFFFEEWAGIPRDYTNSSYRLSFSKGPRSGCISVPVFRKTMPRRFYFGSIYNTTGYYFANAYAFADYCSVDCLGTQQIQEYVDDYGNYIYDKPGNPKLRGLNDSGLGQMFFVASFKTK